jgi:hypothetical protein
MTDIISIDNLNLQNWTYQKKSIFNEITQRPTGHFEYLRVLAKLHFLSYA